MSKKLILTIIGVLLLLIAGYLYQTVPVGSDIKIVSMLDNKGEEIGTIELSETRAGVLLRITASGLTANGEHAIHIHEKGDCSPLETFKNAGGHYNPKASSHGMKHPEGHHAGDMPNIKPDSDGNIKTQILNRNITLKIDGNSKRDTVFDGDGSSIVIHAGADDHVSQPSGAAGARIACGVIR